MVDSPIIEQATLDDMIKESKRLGIWTYIATANLQGRPFVTPVHPGWELLLGLSSPYAARGELHSAVERSFGRDDPHVLVWNADTRSMNPEVPTHIIERAFEEDPVAAASEYGRVDISARQARGHGRPVEPDAPRA